MVNLNKIEMMLSKLQQPLDIDFICKNILKVNEDEGRKILNTFVPAISLVEDNFVLTLQRKI